MDGFGRFASTSINTFDLVFYMSVTLFFGKLSRENYLRIGEPVPTVHIAQ